MNISNPPLNLLESQKTDNQLAKALIEKYQINDDMNQTANRVLMILIAQSNISGNGMEKDCEELKDIFLKYQSLIKDLQEMASQE